MLVTRILDGFTIAEALAIAPVVEFQTNVQETTYTSSLTSFPLDMYDSITAILTFVVTSPWLRSLKPCALF